MPTGQVIDRSQIQGWGADLDLANRPAVPKERTPPRFINAHWDQPEQQPVRMKIYKSLERPHMTPVFGTSTPPSGVSGKIRDVAYAQFSESDIRHWLLLLFADRVNVVEGIIDDLRKGYVPNIFAEMGIKAEFKHNKIGLLKKTLIAASVVGAFGYWMRSRRRSFAQSPTGIQADM